MRRPLAAALAGLILLAACSAEPEGGATPAPIAAPPAAGGSAGPAPQSGAPGGTTRGATGGATGGDAALAGNTGAICTQAVKTGGDFAKTFAANLKLQIDAASAEDRAAIEQAARKSARDVQNYSFALKDLSELAADPAVKEALADMSEQVNALKGDMRRLDESKLTGLGTTLDRACGQD